MGTDISSAFSSGFMSNSLTEYDRTMRLTVPSQHFHQSKVSLKQRQFRLRNLHVSRTLFKLRTFRPPFRLPVQTPDLLRLYRALTLNYPARLRTRLLRLKSRHCMAPRRPLSSSRQPALSRCAHVESGHQYGAH